MQPLRHVAEDEVGRGGDPTPGRRHGADDGAQERGLAGSVRAHDGDDLAGFHMQGDIAQDPLAP
jgi:hypothetical protein